MSRHSDALAIAEGACNPGGMAHALLNACCECIDERITQRDDAAVRLIVSQLAYICGIWDGVGAWSREPDFFEASRQCAKTNTPLIET